VDKKIIIDSIIVHILDNSLGTLVLSDHLHNSNNEINEFIEKHLEKSIDDSNIKVACFNQEENKINQLCKMLFEDNEKFAFISKEMADILYKIMLQNPDIPSADIAFVLLDLEGIKHLAILKFNYRDSYIHYVENSELGNINSIIKQKTALPNENQKIDEFVYINLSSFKIRLLEKKYEIDGEKEFYLSKLFLRCTSDISGKEKIKVLEKTANNIITKYYGEQEIEKRINFKNIINEDLEDLRKIDVERVANEVFGNVPEIKENYIQEVQKKGVTEKEIFVEHKSEKPIYKKQKILTDTGIEINLPLEELKNKDKIEFINNQDGTISILLKNIRDIR